METDEGEYFGVIVERKTILDLIASVRDGRLTSFIERSANNRTNLRAVLVEGDSERSGDSEWPAERLDNLLADAQSLGIIVIRCASGAGARRIASFWRHTGAKSHHTLAQVVRPLVTGYYFDAAVKEAVRGLMSLPGWGETKANAALSEFRSVAAVIEAIRARDYRAFTRVPGIGKGLVDKAADYLELRVK